METQSNLTTHWEYVINKLKQSKEEGRFSH